MTRAAIAVGARAPTATQAKIRTLKESLNTEFAEIFKLCIFVLGASSRPQLISATLRTLKAFLSWIPLGYLFETDFIRTLIERFFAAAQFQKRCIRVPHGDRVLGRPRAEVRPQNNPAVRGRAAGARSSSAAQCILGFRFEATGREADQTFVRRLACSFLGSSRPIYAW